VVALTFGANVIDVLNKYDKRDPTSLPDAIRSQFPISSRRKFTFGVPHEYNIPSLHPSMSKVWSIAIAQLQSAGHKVIKVSLPRTKEALSAYYVLATAEAASNLARYDGVRYGFNSQGNGYKDTLLSSRAGGFGDEVRRRILLGNYTLSARYSFAHDSDCRAFESYFVQAQRVRRLIQYSFDDVFSAENILHNRANKRTGNMEKCDIILCPTAVGPAPELSAISSLTPVETYVNDVFTVPGSLAGLPAINIPMRTDGHIMGLQLLGQVGSDVVVLQAGEELEQILAEHK
jgi:aspartyl-tRNA(Asn)/glutamyl-tRNA(Gln) amidotransferase subunit A